MAGITEGDYRMDGKMELITATTDGESEWLLAGGGEGEAVMMCCL